MFFIAVYDENQKALGYLDAQLKLVEDKARAAGFSSKQTADQTRFDIETRNPEWYTELED